MPACNIVITGIQESGAGINQLWLQRDFLVTICNTFALYLNVIGLNREKICAVFKRIWVKPREILSQFALYLNVIGLN